MLKHRRRVLLIQLPIPQPGLEPAKANVPLAAGYLKLHARNSGLEEQYEIDVLPTPLANTLGDQALVAEILDRDPWLVGFTCYLWNIDRTLWIAERLKERRPDLRIIIGGPEVTADNAWVLDHPAVDFAAIGEGEQTFAELLAALIRHERPETAIVGLHVAGGPIPAFRQPLPSLDLISSPYLAGILDAADEQLLLLETIRGCIFKCKFCYYPKSYDDLYFLSREKTIANLRHAAERGAREVVLLDPTLNQRKDFAGFVRLLAECNPDRQFTYFGELRAEGITPEIARLLRDANFTEVEIGLQSVDPVAQELMDRTNNLRAFERGVRALRDAEISVKVDLIIGLPGDTVESVRRGMHYLRDSGLCDEAQVFNLAILPGTAFRHEADQLGLKFQPRPPYYVLNTPTLDLPDLYQLMAEAEELFDTEFDPLPPPVLPKVGNGDEIAPVWRVDLDSMTLPLPIGGEGWGEGDARPKTSDLRNLTRSVRSAHPAPSPADQRSQAFTLWLRSSNFDQHADTASACISRLLTDNPHTTLQVILEPTDDPRRITLDALDTLRRACFRNPSYLDRFYAVLPGRTQGAKRLVIVVPDESEWPPDENWLDTASDFATVVHRNGEPVAVGVDSRVVEVS
jgi:hypothetical protein